MHSWVNDFRIAGPDALRPKKKGRKKILKNRVKKTVTTENTDTTSVDTSIEHIKELEDELLKLRIENAYLKEREACVHIVDTKKAAYLEHEPHAVLDYFDMALSHSKYPHYFPHTFDMDYDKDNRILIVNYILPPLRVLPRLARVLYDEDKKLFQELILSDRERDILYARLLHELPLRTFHELFTVDVAVSLAAIHFRGYLFLEEERKAGKPPVCALEIQTDRATFAASDLYHGDPAVIFAEMGGVIRSQE